MNGGVMILFFVLRIVGAVVCSNKAKSLNRSTGGWGTFGFLSPIVAMIWIHALKPITIWKSNNLEESNKSSEKSMKNGVSNDAAPYSFKDDKIDDNFNSNSPLKF